MKIHLLWFYGEPGYTIVVIVLPILAIVLIYFERKDLLAFLNRAHQQKPSRKAPPLQSPIPLVPEGSADHFFQMLKSTDPDTVEEAFLKFNEFRKTPGNLLTSGTPTYQTIRTGKDSEKTIIVFPVIIKSEKFLFTRDGTWTMEVKQSSFTQKRK